MDNLKNLTPAIYTDHRPLMVTFNNFEEIRAQLEAGLTYYNSCEYSLDTYDVAAENRDQLKQIKKVLADKKKEMEAAYKAPYADAEEKLNALLARSKNRSKQRMFS